MITPQRIEFPDDGIFRDVLAGNAGEAGSKILAKIVSRLEQGETLVAVVPEQPDRALILSKKLGVESDTCPVTVLSFDEP